MKRLQKAGVKIKTIKMTNQGRSTVIDLDQEVDIRDMIVVEINIHNIGINNSIYIYLLINNCR